MNSVPLIDTHAHVFHRGLALSTTRRYTPTYDATVDTYLAQLDAYGIQRAVLVQPSFLGTDNSYLLDALARHPDRLRGVVVLDADVPHDLDKLHEQGVRGTRLNLVGLEVPDLSRPVWRHLSSRMESLAWHLEVQAKGGQWDLLAERLENWGSRVVIDHLGLPDTDDPHAAEVVAGLGTLDHVWTKVSAPYRSSVPELALRRLLDKTGGTNLLFGTDWPFTGHEDGRSMSTQIGWARDLVGDDAFTRDLPRNAQHLLNWN